MNEASSEYNDEKRVEALRLYDILDTLPEDEFDDITRLASEICQTPIALISLVDDHRQWFKSRVGLEAPETPRDISFCMHAIQGDDVFEVQNAQEDKRFVSNPLVTGTPHIRFYAGAPLISKEGHRFGTLCVINSVPYSISERQKQSLRILARSVMSLLELRREKREAELFKKALNEVSMVSVLNSALTYEYVNDKFCELAAMTREEIVGRPVTEISIADVSKEQEKDALEAVRNGQVVNATVRNLNKKGAVSWSHLVLVPFISKSGELVKVLSVRNDVTREVLMLERLEEAEEIAQTGNWEYDLITGKRYWSKGMYRMMEIDDTTNVPTMLDMVLPEDRERLNDNVTKTLAGQPTENSSEFRVKTPKGNKRDIFVNIKKRHNSKGALTAIYGTIQDITQQKSMERQIAESEAKYRALVEDSNQMTYTTDRDGAYTYASHHLKKTIGYDDDYIIGRKFAFIYDDEWRKKTIAFYVQQLHDKVDETKFVFPIKTKSGEKLWVEQLAQLVREGDEITGFRCVLHDITDAVKTEEAMAEAMRLANEAREMQQTFLGKMSHEIRTPMNGVVGMVNLLAETPLTEKQRIYTESIAESARNMLRIINDILDISKIESGKLVFEETEIDLAQVVNNMILTLKPAADEKRILIASHIDHKIPGKLIADPVRLNQVLLNLAGNAIKFTERGSVIISVSPRSMSDTLVTLEFKVADTGIGIAADKLGSIFESFTQAESDTTRKYGGTGLGLSIARQLVEQQNGTIEVESEPGKGTTFTFTFNFKPVQGSAAPAAPQSAHKAVVHSLKGYHILLVEDNLMNQRVAKFTLENWDAEITIADRGYKALELLKTNTYDLILMDIQMPEMNGIQATIKLRQELHLNTPVIAMTASAMSQERDKCIAAGMNDYITKPFVPEELNKKIFAQLTPKNAAPSANMIDMAYVSELTGNDPAFAKDLFGIYLENTPQLLAAIENSISARDNEALHGHIHHLKNSVGILGAKDLHALLTTAETQVMDSQLPPPATIHMLRTTVKELVLKSLEEVKAKIATL